MSDKFVRHRSTRWVKTAAPSYGDEWGNEFENYDEMDENGEQEYDAQGHEEQSQQHKLAEAITESSTSGDSKAVAADTKPIGTPENLILSIDKLKKYDSNESDGEVDTTVESHSKDTSNEVRTSAESAHVSHGVPSTQLAPDPHNSSKETGAKDLFHDSILSHATPIDHQIHANPHINHQLDFPGNFDAPPRSYVDPPESEISFGSDGDSIQFEPSSISVIDISKRSENEPSGDKIDTSSLLDDASKLNEVSKTDSSNKQEHNDKKEINQSEHHSTSNAAPAPLVLSIDDAKRNYDSSSESENWGYQSDFDSAKELIQEAPLSIQPSKTNLSDTRVIPSSQPSLIAQRRHVKTDALDSLIIDLQQASFEDNVELLPDVNTSGLSMPDFANESFGKDISLEDAPQITTPISPITFEEGLKRHDTYIRELSSRRQSMRKPPTPSHAIADDNDSVGESIPENRVPSISEKSSLGELHELHAVHSTGSLSTGRMTLASHDNEKTLEKYNELEPPIKPQRPDSRRASTMSANASFEGNELEPPIKPQRPDSRRVSTLSDNTTEDTDLEPPIKPQRPDTSRRVSTASANSLESGELEPPIKPQRPDTSRRVSTMSANTLNFGAWKPNTGNFRDKFISDNDNESNINFDPLAEASKNYSKFTNLRDNNSSGDSIPETIDAAVPNENDVLDNDQDDKATSMSTTTKDSVLGDRTFLPTFQEELTSEESKETLPKQKYSSLLEPEKDLLTVDSTHTKSLSASSFATIEQPKKVARTYPVFSWRKIMSMSQPIDRIDELKIALKKEYEYDTGLGGWLQEMLTKSDNSSNMHIGKIAAAAYQNAPHSDFRRHGSIRSKVSIVKDKVEGTGLHASHFGKRFLNKGKKLMMGNND